MTVETDPENDANNEFYCAISNQPDDGTAKLIPDLRMSPGINEAKRESIISSSAASGNPEVELFDNKDLEKCSKDNLNHVINNGPKIERGPNKRKILRSFVDLALPPNDRKTFEKEDIGSCSEVLCKCPLCDECFPSTHSFTLHIRQHNLNNQTTCRLCQKTLSSASSLDRHMLVHSGERPFKCKLCNMAFTTNGNMHRHMRTHGDVSEEWPKLKNSVKRKVPSEAETLSSAKKIHLEEEEQGKGQYMCSVCGKAFSYKYDLMEHLRNHPNDPIGCPDCRTVVKDVGQFLKHQCLEAESSNENEESVPISAVGFHDLSFLDFASKKFPLVAKSVCERETRHPSSAFHNFQCEICMKAFPRSSILEMHMLSHTDKIGTYCHICKSDFETPGYLYEHQLIKHRSVENCWSEYQLTGKEFEEHVESKTDFLILFGLKTTNFKNPAKSESVKEENFDNLPYFVYGKPNSDSNSDFADIKSILSLTSSTSLIQCISSSPVTATPAAPPQSQVSCPHPESPLLAESAQASPATPIKEEPEQPVYKESATESDKQEKTDEVINMQKIPRNHYKLSSQHRVFPCDKCDYASLDKGSLKRHLRTHNGERPFQCIICSFPFTTKANCERHVRKRHKITAKVQISHSMRYNPNMVETNDDGQYPETSQMETVCKYCFIDFKNQRVLRHHLRSLNNSCSRKPYLCNICRLGFSTKNNCIRHITKQHPELKEKPIEACLTSSNSDTSGQNSPFADTTKEKDEPLNLSFRQSSMPGAKIRCLSEQVRDEDIVNAAKGLVYLSEISSPQTEPLDLSVRALDLRTKPNYSCVYNNSIIMKENFALSFNCPETQFSFGLQEHKNENLPQEINQAYKMHNDPYSADRPYLCSYCPSRFTLKSNMDRHIKRKHPEFAKPTRSRNYIPSIPNIEKQTSSAVSTETRNALRFVLSNKGLAPSTSQDTSTLKEYRCQAFNYSKGALSEKETDDSNVNESSSMDATQEVRETAVDLASISDVIDTANCQEFKQILKDVHSEDKLDPNKIKKSYENNPKQDKTLQNVAKNAKSNKGKKRSSYADSPNSIACPYCKRRFPWTSSLRRHILTHTGQKPFKCPKCPVLFTTKSNCERHIGRKHNTSNDSCSRSVPERPFKCNLCTSSTFSTQGNLRKHYYLKHCTKTGFGKNHILDLLSLSKFQKENSQKDASNVAIKKANTNDYSQFSQSNSQTDRVVFCCHICHKKFRMRQEYFAHIEYHYTCDTEQDTPEDLKVSRDDEDPSVEGEEVTITCAFCPEVFESVDRFCDHMMVHLTKDSEPPSRNVQPTTSRDHEVAQTASNLHVRNRSPNSLLYLMQSNDAINTQWNEENVKETETCQNEDNSDLIQNLLGIHDSKIIDQMLDSADSAARLLGVKKE